MSSIKADTLNHLWESVARVIFGKPLYLALNYDDLKAFNIVGRIDRQVINILLSETA